MKVIITGGAGFIGCNAAARYLRRGDEVVVIDNLSRPGPTKTSNGFRRLEQSISRSTTSPTSRPFARRLQSIATPD